MKTFLTLSVAVCFALIAKAQSVVPNNIRASNTIYNDGLGDGILFNGIPMPAGKVIGDTYLDTHWKVGSILLYEQEKLIDRFRIRYDIQTNEIDIQTTLGVKVMDGNKVKSFRWVDSTSSEPQYFINANEYKSDEGEPITSGFLEVVSDGTLPLLTKTYITIKKANYNPQFNMGSIDDKILKKVKYYYMKEGKLADLPDSRKKLLLLFDDKSEAVERFMKERGLGGSKQGDLVLVFNFYNSLVNKS